MTLDTRLADQVHYWLIAEGRKCRSESDLDGAYNRFLERWPRVQPDVLQYVSQMLNAELRVRTFWPSQILDRVRNRIIDDPHIRRRWWQIGWVGSRA
jgi:hypothetical protein